MSRSMKRATHHTTSSESDTGRVIKLTSTAFGSEELIPSKYTCDGIDVSPPLDLDNIPPEARSLAIIVEDPDAPGHTWLHWLAWNIPVINHIDEGRIMEAEGLNDFGVDNYKGPCPPSNVHRYYFRIYALDCMLDLPRKASKPALDKAMQSHILGNGELMGRYKR